MTDMTDMTDVTAADVSLAISGLGINPGDTVLVHSSLKSMGRVSGGPARCNR